MFPRGCEGTVARDRLLCNGGGGYRRQLCVGELRLAKHASPLGRLRCGMPLGGKPPSPENTQKHRRASEIEGMLHSGWGGSSTPPCFPPNTVPNRWKWDEVKVSAPCGPVSWTPPPPSSPALIHTGPKTPPPPELQGLARADQCAHRLYLVARVLRTQNKGYTSPSAPASERMPIGAVFLSFLDCFELSFD